MSLTDGILGNHFRVMSAGLDGLAIRQRVQGENLANINTPGYIAQDVDFESTLQQANAAGESPSARAAVVTGSVAIGDAAEGAGLTSSFAKRSTGQAVSGPAVGNVMLQTSVRYQMLAQQVTHRFSELKSVLNEMGRG